MTWNTLNHAKLNFFKLFDVFLIHSIYILLYSCRKYWQISISKWIITSKSWQIWIKSARVIFSANKKKLHFCWWFWSRKSSQVEHLAYQKNLCLTTHLSVQSVHQFLWTWICDTIACRCVYFGVRTSTPWW